MAAFAARTAGLASLTRLDSRAARVLAAFAALFLIAGLAFVVGEHRAGRTMVLTGVPFLGQNEATVTVDGWAYGIAGDITWFDSQGMHEGSWPRCMRDPAHPVPITFGAVPVAAPDGSSWRQVVWVECPG